MSSVTSQVTGQSESKPPESSITQNTAFEVLDSRRRRQVLYCLFDADGPVELYDMTKQIAAWENDIPIEAVDSTQRMRVYTALKQSHLPKMDDRGVIDYNEDRGIISLTSEAPKLSVYLRNQPHREPPWGKLYLTLGVFGTVLLIGSSTRLIPLSAESSAFVIALLVLIGSVVQTIFHWRVRRAPSGSRYE